MHLLVVGGGSAGHVIPAIPVMAKLLERGDTVSFVGTTSGLEEGLVDHLDVHYQSIQAGKLRRYFSWENLVDVFRVLLGIFQSLGVLIKRRPDVVFSKGGFVSFPVVFAAWLLRIPVLAHESDLSPGLANKLVMPFVATLSTSFKETQISRQNLTVVHVGTPIRDELLNGNQQAGLALLGFDDHKPLLLIVGGSLGADYLNQVIWQAAPQLASQYNICHVCGAGKQSLLKLPGYVELEYVSQGWGDILAAADIVVSRAGANSLFELLALRKLNLLVPLGAKASRGDQIENAQIAAAAGYSLVVQEDELNEASLLTALQNLADQRLEYEKVLAQFETPNATDKLVAEIDRLISK